MLSDGRDVVLQRHVEFQVCDRGYGVEDFEDMGKARHHVRGDVFQGFPCDLQTY